MANSQEMTKVFSVSAQRKTAFNPASIRGVYSKEEPPSYPSMLPKLVIPNPEVVNTPEVLHEKGHLNSCPWPLIETPSMFGEAASALAAFGKDCVKSFSVVALLPISHPYPETPNKFKLQPLLFSRTTRRALRPFRSSGHGGLWPFPLLQLNRKKVTYIFIRIVLYSCLMALIIPMTGIRYHLKQSPHTDNLLSEDDSATSAYVARPKTYDSIAANFDRQFVPYPAQHIQIDSKVDDEPVFFHALMTLDSQQQPVLHPARVKNLKTAKPKKPRVKPTKVSKLKKLRKNKKIAIAKKPKRRDLHPKTYRRSKKNSAGQELPRKVLAKSTRKSNNANLPDEAKTSTTSVIPVIPHDALPNVNWAGEPFVSASVASPLSTTIGITSEALISEDLLPGPGQSLSSALEATHLNL